MIYVHPWEFDPHQPFVRFHWRAMATHYFNLRTTARRYRRLLNKTTFTTMSYAIQFMQARSDLPRINLA